METGELAWKIARVREGMRALGADACLLSVDVNLYYLTGRIYGGYLYLPLEGDCHLFVRRRPDGENDGIIIRKPEEIPALLAGMGIGMPRHILLEMAELSYQECLRLQKAFQPATTGDASTLMRDVRKIKTEAEIAQFRVSAKRHADVYAGIADCFRPGMTDLEFQYEIEYRMRKMGSLGLFRAYGSNMDIFMGSILAGANAEVPSPFDFALGGGGMHPFTPLGACGKPLEEGMAVMVDMAGNYTPYLTDMTRVYSIGRLPEEAYRAHRVSCDIHAWVMETARPGVPCADLYREACAMAERAGLSHCFMGTSQQAKFVGHGVGLQINELPVLAPRSQDVLAPGMVFALEPKFVIPGTGAVGIENTLLVTDDGVENLTVFEEAIIPLA